MSANANNSIDDVRRHLFAALEGLADKENPMTIDRALAVAEVAQTIINSAKVEGEYLRVTDGGESKFLGGKNSAGPALPPGITGVVRHRLR